MYSLNETPVNEYERVIMLEAYIQKASNTDKNALALIYEEIRVPVYNFALSIVKNRSVAEDILQDTIIKIYEAAGSYQAKGKPMAWILRITKNMALMKIRSSEKIVEIDDEDWKKIAAEEKLSPEENILLKTVLNELNSIERQIITLYTLTGLKHREIAEVLNLPLATVLSKYRRSLKKLRSMMEVD